MMTSMVRKVTPALDLVTCREAASYHLLKSMGIDNVGLVPDVVFWLEEQDDARAPRRVVARAARSRARTVRLHERFGAPGEPASRRVRRCIHRAGPRGPAAQRAAAVLMARDPNCQFLEESARRTGAAYFGPGHHFTELWPLLRQAAGARDAGTSTTRSSPPSVAVPSSPCRRTTTR